MWGHILQHSQSTSGNTNKENWLSPATISFHISSARSGDSWDSLSLVYDGVLTRLILCRSSTDNHSGEIMGVQRIAALLNSFCPLFHVSLSISGMGVDTEVLLIMNSQYSNQLWTSALTTAHYKIKLLVPRQKEALVYGYDHKYLKDSSTTWLFSKTIVGSYQGLWPLQPWASDQVYRTRHELSPVEHMLNLVRKFLMMPITSCQ